MTGVLRMTSVLMISVLMISVLMISVLMISVLRRRSLADASGYDQ